MKGVSRDLVRRAGTLAMFRAWREMGASAQNAYLEKIARLSGGDMRRAGALIDDMEAAEDLPTLPAIERMYFARFPEPRRASRYCEYCQGSGFEIVTAGDYTGARKCRCREAFATVP